MMWIIRFVVCLVAVGRCSQLCDASRLEEFLQEKRAYLEEFDSLFDALYLNATSHSRQESEETSSRRQVVHSKPLPSPDWSTRSISYDDVNDGDGEGESDYHLDPPQTSMSEEENYRPLEQQGSGRDVWPEDSSGEGNVSSGDSGLFLTESSEDDDEQDYEDVGSGDSGKQTTTTTRQTSSTVRETTTMSSLPDEDNDNNDAFDLECKDRLRGEMKLCIEFSWNVRTILREMEKMVAQSGYYNVSSGQYFYQLFRTCASTIATPSSCLRVATNEVTMDVVHNIATRTTIAFSSRRKNDAYVDQRHLDCFQTHLQFLRSCLRARVTAAGLETLARVVVVRARDASLQECRDLGEVQQCLVGSTNRCRDPVSVRLVDEMFQAAREVTKCNELSTPAVEISSGTVTVAVPTLGLSLVLLLAVYANI